ncbi:putative aldo/keto reductase [Escherichia coli]|uniref:Putative aldo/keto reductase n=1 Tax=Escherichia coli TaxID=562 RepID=A0A2X3JII2_ECOLX|nr:putative aldo/keto reductase [Escherichia coli]
MAIPKAATIAHVQQNAAVLEVELSSAELIMLDKAYPAPKRKNCADMV